MILLGFFLFSYVNALKDAVFVFFGPFCEGAPPAGGGGENLFPGDYDYIRQGRGHNVCLTVSRDGAEQAVDVCFDLTCRPGGRLLTGL